MTYVIVKHVISTEQIESARCIVNDIAEDIDNKENRRELRTALAIYADLLNDERGKREVINSDKLLVQLANLNKSLEELKDARRKK